MAVRIQKRTDVSAFAQPSSSKLPIVEFYQALACPHDCISVACKKDKLENKWAILIE